MSVSNQTTEKEWYEGNCHCGAVKFKVLSPKLYEHTFMQCNCSICTRNGYINIQPKRDSEFVFHQGEDMLTSYRFGSKSVEHKFCKICGSSVMIDLCGSHEAMFGDALSVNVRMIKDIEVEKLKLEYFDGRTKIPGEYKV